MFLSIILVLSLIRTNEIPLEKNDADLTEVYNAPLKSSLQNETRTNIGKNRVLLHESYNNDSIILLSTDLNNKTLIVPSPDQGFNSTFANITVNNIIANNFTFLHDSGIGYVDQANSYYWSQQTSPLMGSFKTPISTNITEVGASGFLSASRQYAFYIYNATWVVDHHEPNGTYLQPYAILPNNITVGSAGIWNFSIGAQNTFLNNSQTVNNTWFLSIRSYNAQFPWAYELDDADMEVYKYSGGSYLSRTFDVCFNITFSHYLATPTPYSIGLSVNDTNVENPSSQNFLITKNINPTSQVEYNFSSIWPNANWSVVNTIINYTAITDSDISLTMASQQDIYWNLSININQFNSTFHNFTIKFLSTVTWTFDQLFKNDAEQSITELENTLNAENRSILVLSSIANNGSWVARLKSTNIITDIKTQVGIQDRLWAAWDEILNITAITPQLISQNVNLTIFDGSLISIYSKIATFTQESTLNMGLWDISKNVTQYEDVILRVYWFNDTAAFIMEKNITIVAATDIQFSGYPDYSEFISNQFNVSINILDIHTNTNYTDAVVGFNLTKPDASIEYGFASFDPVFNIYNITYNASLMVSGNYILAINVSKPITENATALFHFAIVSNTAITNIPVFTDLTVIRGENATYAFNYMNTTDSSGIWGGIIKNISVLPNVYIPWSIQNDSIGNYRININTSNIDANTYSMQFNISKSMFKTQILSFAIVVQTSNSRILVTEYNRTLNRKDQIPLTIVVYFEDLIQNKPVSNVPTNNFKVLNADDTEWYATGTKWSTVELGNGYYKITVSIQGVNSGNFSLKVQSSYLPNHANAISNLFDFTLLGNWTQIKIISLRDSGANVLTLQSNKYPVYAKNSLFVICNYTDADQNGEFVPENLGNTKVSLKIDNNYYGILQSPQFQFSDNKYSFNLSLVGLDVGDHNLEIIFSQSNYENASISITLTVKAQLKLTFEIIEKEAVSFSIGSSTTLKVKVTYTDEQGSILILAGRNLRIRAIPAEAFEGVIAQTDANGIATFPISIALGVPANSKLQFVISFDGEYDIEATEFTSEEYTVTQGTFTYIIYGLILVLGAFIIIPTVNKKIIQPRKQKHMDLVMSSATIFDDAINIKHVLIIYKSTGTCLFFKSFGADVIDPDLITGFITAIQSFGKELKSQRMLNEMNYGDKILLFYDGSYVRVSLVLDKPASQYLKKNLSAFVGKFEAEYSKKLADWHGQLNAFKDTAKIIDDTLKTSVILPHKMSTDKTLIKQIKNTIAKQVLDIAKSLITEERNFIFLAQLMSSSVEKTKKDPAELILGLNELLNLKILSPIQIEAIAEKPKISDEDLNALRQRVIALPNKSDAEKEEIFKALYEMSPTEREAALSSLSQTVKITTSISGQTVETKKFSDVKEAKSELKKLEKQAIKEVKGNNFDEAVKIYEVAELIAYQWNMDSEGKRFGDLAVSLTVVKHQNQIKQSKKLGLALEKSKNYAKACKEYEKGLDSADQLFKLGFLEVEADSKEISKRIKECQRLSGSTVESKEYIKKENLYSSRKALQKDLKVAQKNDDLLLQTEIHSKLLTIANYLFQFGIFEESDTVKKEKSAIEEIKKKIDDLPDDKKSGIMAQIHELTSKKQQLLDFAKDAESNQDWINALAAYQQVMNLYYLSGDTVNTLNLTSKIISLLQKVPNLEGEIKKFEDEGKRLKSQNDNENAEIQFQYAKTLKDIIFKL